MQRKRLLIVGGGNLCQQILQVLVPRNQFEIHVASRDVEKTTRMCNLMRLAASQQEVFTQLHSWEMNLSDAHIDQNAETLFKIKPDLILNCASSMPHFASQLPSERFHALDQAQLGPWLPLHLAPAYALMRSVKQACPKSLVINAVFPDVVNPVLYKVGLAPDLGVGSVANLVPATRHAIARLAGSEPRDVAVKLVAPHFFSRHVHRYGLAPQDPEPTCSLSYWINGRDYSEEFSLESIFGSVVDEFRRLCGLDGQYLTAMSAVTVLENLFAERESHLHVPGVQGLPGGYPVKVGMGRTLLDLPYGIRREVAIQINEAGQRQDGIKSVLADGTVVFAPEQMTVMDQELNFFMADMKVSDVAYWARELSRKYQLYLKDLVALPPGANTKKTTEPGAL